MRKYFEYAEICGQSEGTEKGREHVTGIKGIKTCQRTNAAKKW